MNPIANPLADPDEVSRFRAHPGCAGAATRFAIHLQRRDPTDVWAPMTLAENADGPEERLFMLQQAVQAGLRRWQPERETRKVAWWDEQETRPFLAAVYALGHQSAVMGFRDDAVSCIKQLLTMDPADRIGAEAMARETGLIATVEVSCAASVKM